MFFEIKEKDKGSEARTGVLHTEHGAVYTPAFMPVATKGTVKTLSNDELHEMGTEMIIANALHLHIRPGEKIVERMGGLHSYMKWDKAIITDSGGFQMIRKNFNIKKSEEGLTFRDFYNGSQRQFTPEMCMDIQKAIGSDVAMLLDDCPVHDASPKKMKESVEQTIRWARRGMEHGRAIGIPKLFAIVQGGTDPELRKRCTEELEKLGPDGFGIGGLSIGETNEKMLKTLRDTVHLLPETKPRYLMGVGSVKELLDSIELGIDVFDSAFPTQLARHGTIFSAEGRYNMRRVKYENDDKPLDEKCKCATCRDYTRSYINHLLREKEMLGMRLASYHNLFYILDIVRRAREAIREGTFGDFKSRF